jgi:uncharacterized protein with GYD domain
LYTSLDCRLADVPEEVKHGSIRKTVKQRPDRIKEVNQEIEAMGVKVQAQYAVLGPYDFVNIVEAADTAAITRVSVELGSRGTVQVMSMPALPVDEFIATIRG